MAVIAPPKHSTVAAIFRAWEANADNEPRQHLGASLLGHPCVRYLWLSFRWARRPQFEGRMLRLFDSGVRAEERFVADLRAIGCEVSEGPAPGQQWRFSDLGGHCGGSMDAAVRGLEEAPSTWHVAEFKTHSAKSFADLAKKGVAKAKPQHAAQVQMYMGWSGMERAAYLAVNKDTDDLYFERLEFDEAEFARLLERAKVAIFCPEPPARLSEDPAWFECKWCDMRDLCHGTAAPEANCRTCVHSTPEPEGEARWTCQKHGDLLLATQRAGCSDHLHFPVLLGRFAELLQATDTQAIYRNTLTNASFANGPILPAYSSKEIHAAQDKKALGDAGIETYRDTFGGRLVG